MRGKAINECPPDGGIRITPACAGKSEKKVPFLPPYQDHPRVCGEKEAVTKRLEMREGSPPRVRGKD